MKNKMIQPVNGHLLIEPVVHDSFVATQHETFEEIGTVLDVYERFYDDYPSANKLAYGDKVYFDSWLAAKYPKNETEWYWLVKWEDVRAIEHAEISE